MLNEPHNTVTIANEHLQYVHALTVFSPNIDLLQWPIQCHMYVDSFQTELITSYSEVNHLQLDIPIKINGHTYVIQIMHIE